MINSNELRIGNWYLQDGKPVKVSEIRHWYFGEDEPIPLTPEILEKAGLIRGRVENFDTNVFYSTGVHKVQFSITISGNFGIVKGIALFVLPINIEYLHQLMNLYFALTGIELEINL